MLLIAYPLSMYGFKHERRCRSAFANDRVVLCFRVFLLGHKVAFSLRSCLCSFCMACGDRLDLNRKKSIKGNFLHAAAWMGVIVSCAVSIGVFAKASIANYPGGEALA